jgi:hypothetical protein
MEWRPRDLLKARVPSEPRRPGTTRTYGYQRAHGIGGGIVLLVVYLREVFRILAEPLPPGHGPIGLLVALMVVFAVLPVGVLIMSQRLGIHVTDQGIDNVGVDTKSFTPWEDIREFVVGRAPWSVGGQTVCIQGKDSRTTPLSKLGLYPWGFGRTQSYCDALNRELAFVRANA